MDFLLVGSQRSQRGETERNKEEREKQVLSVGAEQKRKLKIRCAGRKKRKRESMGCSKGKEGEIQRVEVLQTCEEENIFL